MTRHDAFRLLRRCGVAIAPFLVALGVRWSLGPILADRTPFLLFAAAVVAASIYGGLIAALTTTLLGGAAGIYFIVRSAEGPPLFEATRMVQIALYLAVCAGIGHLINALHRARARVEEFAREQSRLARALAEANAAKDQLLAAVSHDLRTPLSAVIGWSQLMKTNELDPSQTRTALETIERNAVVQERLISDLVDHSRIAEGKLRLRFRTIDPRRLVDHVIDTLLPAAMAKRIRLDSHGRPAASLHADPDRIQQILWNLLSNAVRFTPADGRILVSLTATDLHITLSVQDGGPGIPREILPHVFDRYRQSADSTGGLGLGLAIARQLAEMHGGTIHASNVGPGGGARFDLILPRHVPDSPPQLEAEEARASVAKHSDAPR